MLCGTAAGTGNFGGKEGQTHKTAWYGPPALIKEMKDR